MIMPSKFVEAIRMKKFHKIEIRSLFNKKRTLAELFFLFPIFSIITMSEPTATTIESEMMVLQ